MCPLLPKREAHRRDPPLLSQRKRRREKNQSERKGVSYVEERRSRHVCDSVSMKLRGGGQGQVFSKHMGAKNFCKNLNRPVNFQ